MIQKQKTKNNKNIKATLVPKKVSCVCKDKNITSSKSSQSGLKQISNYRSFLRYLLSDDVDSELADES